MSEVALVAPVRMDSLLELIQKADQYGTKMEEVDDLGALDYNYGMFISSMIQARGKIDALINSTNTAYIVRTTEGE